MRIRDVTTALFIFLVWGFGMISYGQVLSLEKIAGPPLKSVGKEHGAYFLAYHRRRKDTLWVWAEHADRSGERPNYEAADHADLVVWCYPQRYPHKNHIFPDGKGIVYGLFEGKEVWFMTGKALSEYWPERVVEKVK